MTFDEGHLAVLTLLEHLTGSGRSVAMVRLLQRGEVVAVIADTESGQVTVILEEIDERWDLPT